jgi:predicted RNA-binding protein with PUA domain
MSIACHKCGQSNPDSVRFCTKCHFPLRFVCPACAHTQRVGRTCEACGVDFEKFGLTQLSRMKLESERETARLQKQTSVFREVILAIATGGLSLLKYLRSRR